MHQDTLQHIDYLREKADISYEEAMALLEQMDGDVMRALVDLERQGRLYAQVRYTNSHNDQSKEDINEAKEKAASFLRRASKSRVVIERKRADGEKETLMNVSAPIAAGVTLFAPYITLAGAALTLATGYQVKVEDFDKKED